MDAEQLRYVSTPLLIAIALNVKHYEANESRDELVLELALRLETEYHALRCSDMNVLLKDDDD